MPVRLSNRKKYVKLYIEYMTSTQIKGKFDRFYRGFQKVCGDGPLNMCRPEELELLLCGDDTEVNFEELKAAAQYDDGYNLQHPLIIWFWEIVSNFSGEQKRNLLSFVTSSHRVPLGGLGSLQFVIQRNGPDTERLPSSLTCFGRLLLPEYCTKEKLKDRLNTSLENSQGFGLV